MSVARAIDGRIHITTARMVSGIVHALSDEYARKTNLAAMLKVVSVEQLTQESEMPIGPCHRRVHELVEQGRMTIDKIIITPDGEVRRVRERIQHDPNQFSERRVAVEWAAERRC